MDAGSQRGQAAVEWVGVTVLVMLAVAAITLWLVPVLRPPPAPPDVIGRIALPVAPATPAEVAARQREAALERLALVRGRPGGTAVQRGLGAVRRDLGTGFDVWLEARHEFSTSFNRRMLERLDQMLHDPLGDPTALPDLSLLTPAGIARRADEMRAYLRRLDGMSLREAIVTASGDAGAAAADLTVDAGQVALRKKISGATRRPRPPEPPPAPRPGAPRP